jgi:hypothetical protein
VGSCGTRRKRESHLLRPPSISQLTDTCTVHSTKFQGRPEWLGPTAGSGNQASPEDPFAVTLGLSAAAPPFQPGPPPPPGNAGMGGSSSESPPAPEGDHANNSGNGHRANEGRSGGSSSREGQPSDDTGPVIANGSTPSTKGKQPVGADPMADATRFLCVPGVQTDDFDPNMLFGRVKALVSKHHFFTLTS